jgi:hypothetical protein
LSNINFNEELDESRSLSDTWELVKKIVSETFGARRAGLSLGVADLGFYKNGYIGAFYLAGSNYIIMNKNPLDIIKRKKPDLYNPYCFYILLHEYIHALGITNEKKTRKMVYEINRKAFGEKHIVTQLSRKTRDVLSKSILPEYGWTPSSKKLVIEIISDFDRSNTTYIT